MATPQERVRDWALSQVGYVANPGKWNKYAEKLDKTSAYNGRKNGYDWCDVFADSAYIECFGFETAIKMINQPKNGCGAGCPWSAGFYRAAGQWSSSPSLGAQIFFGSRGDEYHTGIVVGYDSNYVYTVEGNTGYSQGYSGGAVLRRTYSRSDGNITGYGVPKWSLAGGSDAETSPKPSGKLDVDGYAGPQTIMAWQKAMGTTVDGYIGGQSAYDARYMVRLVAVQFGGGGSQLVRAVQIRLGCGADGYLGPITIRAIQRFLGVAEDGYFGPETVKALQRSLNDGKWK